MRVGAAGGADEALRALAEGAGVLGGDAGLPEPVGGVGREGDVLGQEAGEKGEEEGLGRERVAGAAFEAEGGGVEVGHLAGVAGEEGRSETPEQGALQLGVTLDEAGDQVGVEGDGDDQRVLAPALKGVGVRGSQEQECALGEVAAGIGSVVAQGAVLDPQELEEVVVVEAGGAGRRQGRAGQGDGVAPGSRRD
jgi:hypothetical protein